MAQSQSAMDKIIDWNLNKLPSDPIVQTRYMYYLQGIILATLIGFTLSNVYSFFRTGTLSYVFGAILTGIFCFMTLFSFKQMRMAYKAAISSQNASTQAATDEITPEMMEKERKDKENGTKPDNPGYLG